MLHDCKRCREISGPLNDLEKQRLVQKKMAGAFANPDSVWSCSGCDSACNDQVKAIASTLRWLERVAYPRDHPRKVQRQCAIASRLRLITAQIRIQDPAQVRSDSLRYAMDGLVDQERTRLIQSDFGLPGSVRNL